MKQLWKVALGGAAALALASGPAIADKHAKNGRWPPGSLGLRDLGQAPGHYPLSRKHGKMAAGENQRQVHVPTALGHTFQAARGSGQSEGWLLPDGLLLRVLLPRQAFSAHRHGPSVPADEGPEHAEKRDA